MTEEEMGIMDADEQEEDEKPHARGPEEIGMEDTGPQERPTGAGLDMEAAVGRTKRDSSMEREFSPQDAALSDTGSKDETMKDVEDESAAADAEKEDEVKVEATAATPEDTEIVDADAKPVEDAPEAKDTATEKE